MTPHVIAPLALLLSVALASPPVAAQVTIRASVGPGGVEANGPSVYPSVSATGRYVAFYGSASNLVPLDTNGVPDVFVRDLVGATTTRVSVDPAGMQGDGESEYAWISADGSRVAFASEASNFAPGTTGEGDIFVRDLVTKTTTLVSVSSTGEPGDLESTWPALSADGRAVVYWSFATNLVPGDTNGAWDVFVRDLEKGLTTRVSVASGGIQSQGDDFIYNKAPALSADGRFVAFESSATDLVPGDTNGVHDVFVHDRADGTTTRVSVGPGGVQGNRGVFPSTPSLSADGRHVGFASYATNLVPGDTNSFSDVFVHDRLTATTTRVSLDSAGAQSDRGAETPTLAANVRFVAFKTWASLEPGDTNERWDVYVRNLARGTTTRVSVGHGGTPANDNSGGYPTVASDGRWAAFHSSASNLVPGDTNGVMDVFVRVYSRVR